MITGEKFIFHDVETAASLEKFKQLAQQLT